MKLITLAAIAAITLTTSAFGNESIIPVSKEIKDITVNLRDKAIKDDSAYEILKSLTTEVGARHPGTPVALKRRKFYYLLIKKWL